MNIYIELKAKKIISEWSMRLFPQIIHHQEMEIKIQTKTYFID